MARNKSANMTTSNSLTSSVRRNTRTGALKWRCGHSAERCFHTAHVTTRCADEYSKLSAELPHSFHLLYVTSLKSMPKGLVCCGACSSEVWSHTSQTIQHHHSSDKWEAEAILQAGCSFRKTG